MKVKRFKNLWAMGLILCGVLLVAFLILKIFFPEIIIGVAEIPRVVKFGEYVDSNLWAYYLFTFLTSFLGGYVYTCACCKKKVLNWKGLIVVIFFNAFPLLIYAFFPQIYTPTLYLSFILMPFFTMLTDKDKDYSVAINIIICFSLDIIFASLSVIVRDISLLVSYPNSATFTILLIDGFIWRALMYFYCNNKKGEF